MLYQNSSDASGHWPQGVWGCPVVSSTVGSFKSCRVYEVGSPWIGCSVSGILGIWRPGRCLELSTFLGPFRSSFCDVALGHRGVPFPWGSVLCLQRRSGKVGSTLMPGPEFSQQIIALLRDDQCYSLHLSLFLMLWLIVYRYWDYLFYIPFSPS